MIKENIQTEIVVKKSKFICNLIKVESQEDAENVIKQLKKKYYDARHNCVAYRVVEDDKIIENKINVSIYLHLYICDSSDKEESNCHTD